MRLRIVFCPSGGLSIRGPSAETVTQGWVLYLKCWFMSSGCVRLMKTLSAQAPRTRFLVSNMTPVSRSPLIELWSYSFFVGEEIELDAVHLIFRCTVNPSICSLQKTRARHIWPTKRHTYHRRNIADGVLCNGPDVLQVEPNRRLDLPLRTPGQNSCFLSISGM